MVEEQMIPQPQYRARVEEKPDPTQMKQVSQSLHDP